MTNAENALKRSTDELVGGINKLGANIMSTARNPDELVEGINKLGANIISSAKAVPYTNYGNPFKKVAAAAEDAIVTVKAGIVKNDEEPELEAIAKMPLFFPLIRSSVPLSDLAKGLPVQKTTISYLEPSSILVSLQDHKRFLTVTAKMIAARQAELNSKMKDTEMSSGRKVVFTLAMKVTDLRHFHTQFSEVGRFHSNIERTKQTISDILGMFEKLNSLLPTEARLDSFTVFAASNPTISSSHSSQKFTAPSPHSSLNYASLNFPSSQSSGSFATLSLPPSQSSGSLATYNLPSSHSSGNLASYNSSSPHNSGKFSTLNIPSSHSSLKNFSSFMMSTNPATTISNATNNNTTTADTTASSSNTISAETTNSIMEAAKSNNTNNTSTVITNGNEESENSNSNNINPEPTDHDTTSPTSTATTTVHTLES